MLQLILLGTSGCHLCEDAQQIIDSVVMGFEQPISLEHIDIAEQEQWQEQYAIRIPVLYHAKTGDELDWPFDAAAVQAFLQRLY
jgi:glutaredoxin